MRASQQHRHYAPPLVEVDWHAVLGGILIMALLTVVGPITLLLGWLIRAWCKRSLFDAHDRWDSVRAFAWCFGLLTAVTVALAICAFIISPGQAFHLWTHSPLHALGAPDLFGNLWLRWVVSVPLAFALALSMGWGETRLVRRFTHVPTEREQQQLAEKRRREQEERVRREQQAEATKRAPTAAPKTTRATLTASASPSTNSTPRPASPPLQKTGISITKALGQGKPTLWDELPTDHPWKQEAERLQNQQQPQLDQMAPPVQDTPSTKKEKPDLGDGSMDSLL